MIIIPAIDLIDGKLVRLNKGDYESKKDYGLDPVEMAKRIEGAGLTHLHLVDLDGAKGEGKNNLNVLEKIAHATSLEIDFGGGVKDTETLLRSFSLGARKVTCGSIAAHNEALVEEWISRFTPDKLVLGADCRNRLVAVSGWEKTTNLEVSSFIENYLNKGLKRVVCTDIAHDGMLNGPSIGLYQSLIDQFGSRLELVASGGVSSVEDLQNLQQSHLYAAIVGKAIYEGRVSLEQLKKIEENRCVS